MIMYFRLKSRKAARCACAGSSSSILCELFGVCPQIYLDDWMCFLMFCTEYRGYFLKIRKIWDTLSFDFDQFFVASGTQHQDEAGWYFFETNDFFAITIWFTNLSAITIWGPSSLAPRCHMWNKLQNALTNVCIDNPGLKTWSLAQAYTILWRNEVR